MRNPFKNSLSWPISMIVSFYILLISGLLFLIYLAHTLSGWVLLLIPGIAAARFGYYIFKGK